MIEVACGIIQSADGVLAVERGVGMSHPGKWEFPGGKRESGETPEECLARELREELAIAVTIIGALPAFSFPVNDRPVKFFPFIATLLEGTPILHEHAQLRWCDRKELSSLDWLPADVVILENYYRWCCTGRDS